MSFTPEQEAALDNKLNALAQTIGSQLNGALSGLAKRLTVDELPKAIAAQISPIQEQLASLPTFDQDVLAKTIRGQFDALLEELGKEEEGANNNNQPPQPAGDSPAIIEMRKQMEAMKEQVDLARKVAEQERTVREQMTEQTRLTSLDNAILDALRGKVRPGTERELLTLMKSSNTLLEDKEQNAFVVDVKDEYGLTSKKPAVEMLDDLISNRWQHYLDIRPGTGTGASPAGGNRLSSSTSTPETKHFKVQNGKLQLSDADLDAAAREGKLEDVIKELQTLSA